MVDKEFRLCSTCSKRQSDKAVFAEVPARQCFICRGLILKVPPAERRALQVARRYQFKTFSVGMVVPAEVQEREDQVRSEIQIRGVETIKSQSSRDVSDFLRKKTRRRIDRKHPELTFLVDLGTGKVSATAKSLFVHARYTKPQGVSQRREFCEECSGRGCDVCNDGFADTPSIEQVVGNRLCRILRSPRAKFTWIGSEDVESVVFPPGRPFIVEMKDPRRRKVPVRFDAATGKGRTVVSGARVLRGKPEVAPAFVFRTRAYIEAPQQSRQVDLREGRKLVGVAIQHRNNKGKTVYKKVYSIRVRRKVRGLEAEIKLDGGLPVKRLISGESVSPSLSEVLGMPLVCDSFDILKVWETTIARSDAGRRPTLRR